jgi:phage terminase small subunit
VSLTAKQEAFCQAVVSGMTQADAYRAAYNAGNMKPETVQSKACLLMADGKVRARVDEIRAPVVEKVQYGLEQAMQEAAEAFLVAKGKENGGAMVAAVNLRAKLNGLLVDRSEIRTGPLDGIEHAELKALNAAIAAVAGFGGAIPRVAGETRH